MKHEPNYAENKAERLVSDFFLFSKNFLYDIKAGGSHFV